jgi:hypothetical protein
MPRLRRRVLAIALSLAVLASVSLGGSGRAATDRTAKVVVINSGVVPGGEGPVHTQYGYAQYGLVLRNRSSTRDAIDVTVEVEGVDAGGRSFTDSYTTITLIPAASNFVISGPLIWGESAQLAGIETEVHVGQTAPRSRRLPPVKHLSVANRGNITGSLTNPYKRRLPESATIYGVVLDSRGRIVAAGYDVADAVTRPGATVSFDIFGNVPKTAQLDAVTSARVSVDPCGYLAFTRVCPVPGAQS